MALTSIAACFVVVWAVAYYQGAKGQGTQEGVPALGGFYASRYDNLDVEIVLENKRLVKNYADCILGRKPCTPAGKEIRRLVPEVLRSGCGLCTKKQLEGTVTMVRRLQRNYPDLWDELEQRFDPTGELIRRIEDNYNGNRVFKSPTPITLSNRFNDQEQTALLNSLSDDRSPSPSANIPIQERPNALSLDGASVRPILAIVTSATPTKLSTTLRIATTTTTTPRPPPSTSMPPSSSMPQPNWLDQFGARVLRTAGMLTNIFLRSIERVVATGKPAVDAVASVTVTRS